jgi:hypothetical protein
MSDTKNTYPWNTTAKKPKELSISEIMQQRRGEGSCSPGRVNLRDVLVRRTMARHGFTEAQALALILAFRA